MTLPNKTINKMYRRLCTGIFACRCPYRLCFVHISFMYNFFGIFTQKFSLKQHFYVAIFVDSLQSNFIISVSKTFGLQPVQSYTYLLIFYVFLHQFISLNRTSIGIASLSLINLSSNVHNSLVLLPMGFSITGAKYIIEVENVRKCGFDMGYVLLER